LASLFKQLKHWVDPRKPALNAFGERHLSGEYAVTLKQL
jgi:hypothetical protein